MKHVETQIGERTDTLSIIHIHFMHSVWRQI